MPLLPSTFLWKQCCRIITRSLCSEGAGALLTGLQVCEFLPYPSLNLLPHSCYQLLTETFLGTLRVKNDNLIPICRMQKTFFVRVCSFSQWQGIIWSLLSSPLTHCQSSGFHFFIPIFDTFIRQNRHSYMIPQLVLLQGLQQG